MLGNKEPRQDFSVHLNMMTGEAGAVRAEILGPGTSIQGRGRQVLAMSDIERGDAVSRRLVWSDPSQFEYAEGVHFVDRKTLEVTHHSGIVDSSIAASAVRRRRTDLQAHSADWIGFPVGDLAI